MKLSEKKNSTFTPHPETDGPIKAVIVDITELKKRMTQYGEKEEFRFVFETDYMDEENDRRFCIWSRGYTPSLNEKAALRKDLKKMMGRELTTAELEEFDPECLIGHGLKLIIQHEQKDDRVFANISFIAPDKDGKPLKPSGKYKRIKDREKAPEDEEQAAAPTASGWEDVIVHVGKYKGKRLADVDEVGVKTLITKWLPMAKESNISADAELVSALMTLDALLTDDDTSY